MTTLLILRHGESEANGSGFFAGQTDINLSEKGKRQAELTARYISENYSVDKIYSSDLKRAVDTVRPLSSILGKEIITDENLREINAGKWQGKTFNELERDYTVSYGVWLKDIGKAKPDGGESVEKLAERIYGEMEKIAKKNIGKTVVIATHATPVRAMLCKIQNGDVTKMKAIPWVSNASLTELCFNDGKFEVVFKGRDDYMDNLRTTFPANV